MIKKMELKTERGIFRGMVMSTEEAKKKRVWLLLY